MIVTAQVLSCSKYAQPAGVPHHSSLGTERHRSGLAVMFIEARPGFDAGSVCRASVVLQGCVQTKGVQVTGRSSVMPLQLTC